MWKQQKGYDGKGKGGDVCHWKAWLNFSASVDFVSWGQDPTEQNQVQDWFLTGWNQNLNNDSAYLWHKLDQHK